MYFEYGEKGISYLKQKDKHLTEVIEKIYARSQEEQL